MNWNLFSFFLTSEESFIEFNTNILETNLINIFLLIGLLLYANKVSFSGTLENRQKDIIQTIENAQKDVLNASNYYYLAEKGFTQSLFWLQSWKILYEKDKVDLVNSKYQLVKSGLEETFSTTENLLVELKGKTILEVLERNTSREILCIRHAFTIFTSKGFPRKTHFDFSSPGFSIETSTLRRANSKRFFSS